MAGSSTAPYPYGGCPKEEDDDTAHGRFPVVYKGSFLLPRPAASAPPFYAHAPPPYCASAAAASSSESRATAALRVHSQAEKRRRERINAHLATLRRMIPDATKMDKASLLGRVIEQVRELKRKAVDIGEGCGGFAIPTEVNEVTVECDASADEYRATDEENLCIKASVCCDDRPDLFADLIQAFHELRLRTVRADLTSLGGRVQNVFILCREESNATSVSLKSLKKSIRDVLDRVASTDLLSTSSLPSKRQRHLQSYYSNVSL